MSLSEYRKKRSFTRTTEPKGGKTAADGLHFVVQKHDASHLHYDFRLEMKGVLKSWAVPKGPSLDPSVKRLAMMVEDHPYDYRNFEGTISEGNYGAGTVIVWDEGTYQPAESVAADKKTQEKELLAGLKKKKLKFVLHGKKLKGSFALVKSGYGTENAWLLMKMKDDYASEADITLKDKSVLSKRTLAQVRKAADKSPLAKKNLTTAEDFKKKKTIPVKKILHGKQPVNKTAKGTVRELLNKAPKASFPKLVKPMLATRVSKAFDGADWIYEIKWDGYRALAYLTKGKATVYSRNRISFNAKFPSVVEALQKLGSGMVLDGEIIALDENDRPSFQLLQNHSGNDIRFVYYVFDILWYQGKDLRGLALFERKTILQSILPETSIIRYSNHITGTGKDFFEVAVKHGLEGIMAKKASSTYAAGQRSSEWLKIKNEQRLEAIICGFTEPRNNRSHFGAVILGKYKGNKLEYIGHSGSGFNEAMLASMYRKFKPLITKTCPFAVKPKTNMPVTWLKPELVCEVKFTEWTGEKILRHPIFMGLREDKKAANEKNEKMIQVPATAKKISKQQPSGPVTTASGKMIPQDVKEATLTIKKHTLKFTNLAKLYWPVEKITKRDMLNYYLAMAPYIMPYMKDRPQSMHRHPDGISKPNFFQKNITNAPDWIKTLPVTSDTDKTVTNYLVCTDEAALLYMASQGCIEMNPWHSRVKKVDYPDWCVIDLDPDINTFNKVIETAHIIKQVLDSAGVKSYCKTSGSTGLHIYIPLGAKYSYDQSRMLAQLVVQLAQRELPSFTSIERSPAKRKGKIYLDYLQNKRTQTIAAPYSLRPKPGTTVSTPLYWEEITKGLRIKDHTIHNIMDRLKETGDIFTPVLGAGINLKTALKKIEALL